MIHVCLSMFNSQTEKLKNCWRSVAAGADQCILTVESPALSLQCPGGGGIPPSTLLVWPANWLKEENVPSMASYRPGHLWGLQGVKSLF